MFRPIRGGDGSILDHGVVLFFPGPRSFTGEDVAELQIHGGRATIVAVLSELGAREAFRQAEAGEFTRRAFLNDRFDLTAVEALSDLIAAETEAQRRFALGNNGGAQRLLYEGWRARLIKIRALVEALLDFAEEDDVSEHGLGDVLSEAERLRAEMTGHMADFHRSEIIRDGYDVVILGKPNAGKSTLLNALARREVAIVSDEAGTTRDLVEVSLDLGGYKIRLTDTAGLRDADGKVERLGIERAKERAQAADLVVVLDDSGDFSVWDGDSTKRLDVHSKIDLGEERRLGVIGVAAEKGDGLEALRDAFRMRAAAAADIGGGVLPSRVRHVELITAAVSCLGRVLDHEDSEPEFFAEELRLASHHIGRISGRIDVEDLLDVIFSEFCIGK